MLYVTSSLRVRTFALSTLVLASTSFVLAQAPTAPSHPAPVSQPAASIASATPAPASNNPAPLPRLSHNDALGTILPTPPESATGPLKASKDSADGSHVGITVHGHWTIDVKNPDGTLAEHRDFENSLQNPNLLLALLEGYYVMSDYMIAFSGSTQPCVSTAGYCGIVHNLATEPANGLCTNNYYYCSTGLTITFNTFPANMILAGQLTATQAGNINAVYTLAGVCENTQFPSVGTITPAACQAGTNGGTSGYSSFTGTSITPLSVISGQIIQVTVTITFS